MWIMTVTSSGLSARLRSRCNSGPSQRIYRRRQVRTESQPPAGKIEENPAKPRYIETVWGAGYRFRG